MTYSGKAELTPRQSTTEPLPDLEPLFKLEPLPGSIVPQFIRCGKLGCHCQTGDRHGPYFYRVWREGNKVCKVYVKVTDVETVQEQTRLYEEQSAELKRLKQLRAVTSASFEQKRRVHRKEQKAEMNSAGKNSADNKGSKQGRSLVERQAIQARLSEETARSHALSLRVQTAAQGAKTARDEAQLLTEEAYRTLAASRELRAKAAEGRRQRAEAS